MMRECICPSFYKQGVKFFYMHDPACPKHGKLKGNGILRDMKDAKQAAIEELQQRIRELEAELARLKKACFVAINEPHWSAASILRQELAALEGRP